MKPMFIVIEALDGVGKTTLVNELAASTGAVGMNTPGNDLRKISVDVFNGLGDHQTARCLFYAASVLARGKEARQLVENGRSVIMDRYWLSTIAYARARGVQHTLKDIESLVPHPDLTVFLTLDEDERIRRMMDRGKPTAADCETLKKEFRDAVYNEIFNTQRCAALRPTVSVDITNCKRNQTVQRVLAAINQVTNAPAGCEL